jgi:peptidoglycan/xylan/chitin deacetylase (PgdA/CDA1 family)
MYKDLVARALQSRLGDHALRVLERSDGRRPNLFKVLTYHRVSDPEGFERQMAYLAAHYHVISVPDLLSALREDRPLPPYSVAITFDDAYQSFGEIAWPVLERHRLPATLFVATGYPDRPEKVFWWDKVEEAFQRTPSRDPLESPLGPLPMGTDPERKLSLKRLKGFLKKLPQPEIVQRAEEIAGRLGVSPQTNGVLGWEALRRLSGQGVTLGAHSRNHPLMDRIPAEEAMAEVVGSLEDLRREIGQTPPIFAYPDGRYSRETVDVLRQAGIALAFTTRRGANVLGKTAPLELRRINISRCSPTSVLRLRLIHSSVYLNRWKPLFDA